MNNQFKTSKFIFTFFKKHYVLFILLIISVIGSACVALLPSFALQYLIDNFICPAVLNSEVNQSSLIIMSLVYFSTYLLIALFTFFENYIIDICGQKLIHVLRLSMIEKEHRLKSSFFSNNGSGEMTSRVTDDVYAIEVLFANGFVEMTVDLFKIISILASIFVFSWVLGLLLLVFIPIIFVITQIFRKKMLKNQLANRKVLNKESNSLSESIDNIETIKNLSKEQYREDSFHELLNEGYVINDKTSWFDSVYSPIINLIQALVISLVTCLVAYGINSSYTILGITVGTFAAALNLITDIFKPIGNIGQEFQTIQEGISGTKRIENFMNEKEIGIKDDSISSEAILKNIQEYILKFDELSFHYEDSDTLIFDKASFNIKRNEKVVIVGRTGAGKTTLLKLILGIVEPTNGEILLNNFATNKIPDIEKRKLFGYVEQDFRPIPGSIMEQITLKDSSITLDEVRKAMKSCFLDEYVMNNIEGNYNAQFKEEDFSRGQLQLLGLARAIVMNPSIILLDEISANLDSNTENLIINALDKAFKDRTVISVSHRLSDKLGFTRTIKVDEGKVYKE
ncbi:MAG: ABC transporter ATP-binding protein [Bacilli bacterium]